MTHEVVGDLDKTDVYYESIIQNTTLLAMYWTPSFSTIITAVYNTVEKKTPKQVCKYNIPKYHVHTDTNIKDTVSVKF